MPNLEQFISNGYTEGAIAPLNEPSIALGSEMLDTLLGSIIDLLEFIGGLLRYLLSLCLSPPHDVVDRAKVGGLMTVLSCVLDLLLDLICLRVESLGGHSDATWKLELEKSGLVCGDLILVELIRVFVGVSDGRRIKHIMNHILRKESCVGRPVELVGRRLSELILHKLVVRVLR